MIVIHANHSVIGLARLGADRPQGRPDARCPGDCEGDPGDQRPARAGPIDEAGRSPLAVQGIDPAGCDEEDSHGDHQPAGQVLEQGPVVGQEAPDPRCCQAEQDEYDGKAGNEDETWKHDSPPAGGLEFVRLEAGNRREVARHQRKDAGREEGNDSGRECGGQTYSGSRIDDGERVCEGHILRLVNPPGRTGSRFPAVV